MYGLAVLGVLLGYFLISLWVIKRTRRWARDHQRSPKRWGWGAALGMYLLVFWDWIPSLLVHRYYCGKEGGFFVYKTLEQWKQENPGIAETLVANEQSIGSKQVGNKFIQYLNQRFRVETVHEGAVIPLLPIRRSIVTLFDSGAEQRIAQYVNFYGGGNLFHANAATTKLWPGWRSCEPEPFISKRKFSEFKNKAKRISKES